MFLENIDKNKPIHFVGIGGSSMSGIAEMLFHLGYKVSGSDRDSSKTTVKLENDGIKIMYGHNPENVENATLVVYTAAIKLDNPELVRAKELSIPVVERADFLGDITKQYTETIAICGTHGKTTTTSMLALTFIDGGKDPSVHIGGNLKDIGGNYRIGHSDYFVIEACEYVESFLSFHPETAVVLNIEEDHLDYYKDLNHIKSAFRKFVELVPETGLVVANGDDINCLDVVKDIKPKLVTFGIKNRDCDWIADNIELQDNGCYSFTAKSKSNNIDINLSIIGYHNIYNALSAVATSYEHGISLETIAETLKKYTGTCRRFEYVGEINGAKIYDDYAHHPTEIKSLIKAAHNIQYNKMWVVFQPFTYSRTVALFDDFAHTFEEADNVLLTDILGAREVDTGIVNSQQLAIAINEVSNNCTYIPKFEGVVEYLKEHAQENDIILTVGCGTVTQVGYMLIK